MPKGRAEMGKANRQEWLEEIGGLDAADQAIVICATEPNCTGVSATLTLPSDGDCGELDYGFFNFYLGFGTEVEAGISFTRKPHDQRPNPYEGYWKFFVNPGDSLILSPQPAFGDTVEMTLVIGSDATTKLMLSGGNYSAGTHYIKGEAAHGKMAAPAKTTMALSDPGGWIWFTQATFSHLRIRVGGYGDKDWKDWKAGYTKKTHLCTRLTEASEFPLATACSSTAKVKTMSQLRQKFWALRTSRGKSSLQTQPANPLSQHEMKHHDILSGSHKIPGPIDTEKSTLLYRHFTGLEGI
jgi:hypothetical protein